ncbi:unnamed protein product [Macrosiphum euphorbiae]|uniref:Uncharacterized protein n=1 Tax=Macrosiphum euphorbiae TaxID=13131 RepID=A0AAV0X0V0_9HEMI|nr:unnamed protein product [Macrosiphum euphorbiae]
MIIIIAEGRYQRYDSLKQFVDNLRDDFESIENEAILLSGCTTYEYDKKRFKKRKQRVDELIESETEHRGKTNVQINTFYIIIDTLTTQLKIRSEAYSDILNIFGCIPVWPC